MKYALCEEGANLSGLDEETSEKEKLTMDMLKQTFNMVKSKEEQKAKDVERNEKMLTHEKNMLATGQKRQPRVSN